MNARKVFDLILRGLGLLLAFATTAVSAAPKTTDSAKVTTSLAPEGGRMIIDAQGVPPPPPLFFSAAVEQAMRLAPAEITSELKLKLHVLQGKPEVMTVGLSGDGEVVEVSGKNLRDWSVRQAAGPPTPESPAPFPSAPRAAPSLTTDWPCQTKP